MKTPYTGAPGTDWQLAEGTYAFSGTPGQCVGELVFVNHSDNKLKVRSLDIETPARHRKNCHPLGPTRITLGARVAPRSEARFGGVLQLPLDTPPGHYQGSVVCGEQRTAIDVEVLPYRDMLIEPNHLRMQGDCGETVKARLTIRNLGNVPIELGDVGMIWFREHAWIGRTLVYSLRELEADETFEQFSTRVLHNFQRDMVAPARVVLEPKNIDALAPGQVIQRTLKLKLPAGIKKGRSYLGFIKINEARIWLEIFCTGNKDANAQEPAEMSQ